MKSAPSLLPSSRRKEVRDEVEKILLTTRPETMSAAISFWAYEKVYKRRRLENAQFCRPCKSMPRKPLSRWVAFSIMLRKYGYIPSASEFLKQLRLDGRTIRCCCTDAEVLFESGSADGQSRLEKSF